MAAAQVAGDGGLHLADSSRGGERWSYSGCILKREPIQPDRVS